MTAYPERVLQQAYAWMRGHPRVADGMLALLLLAAGAGQIPGSHPQSIVRGISVNLLLAGTVAIRRWDPVAAFCTAVVIASVQLAFGLGAGGLPDMAPGVTDLAIVILVYTLAAYRPRRVSLTGLLVCVVGAAVAIARYAPLHEPDAKAILLLSIAAVGATLLAAWILGDSAAYRRAYYLSLEQRVVAAERARDLEIKRARAIDESAARLRGIERDLHDGAQVRLAALAMALGEIKESLALAGGDPGTLRLLGSAHQNAKDTLAELRDLARGIHPPVLDRGLGAALAILGETSTVPVALAVDLADRPSPAIEAIAYFCTAELLANAAKHSGAKNIQVSVRDPGPLTLTVTDDGAGGARVAPRGGLAGLLERVQTVDGQLTVDSPPGGPTTITIELPRHA
jgi:signal transduction histidine kinase